MAYDASIQRYRNCYARLLRLYPKPYHERFGEGMEQTFHDLLRERAEDERGVLGCALWMSVETSAGVMRENMKSMIMQHKPIVRIALATALLLMVPLVAMQFTDEVVWTLFDFVVAGALLFGTGVSFVLVARHSDHLVYKAAAGLALASGLFLIWSNLAVGLIGNEDEPANLMYFAVIAVGIVGAFFARFRPLGMARAMFAMALTQAFIAVIALLAGMDQYPESSVVEIIKVNMFFVALFGFSALLFRHAAPERPSRRGTDG